MAVDNASDDFDFEYDFDFELDPTYMIQDTYYCFEDKEYYPVSRDIKNLINIGQGIATMLSLNSAFYEGRLSERAFIANAAK